MRAFLTACLVILVVALGAMAVLGRLVQQPVSKAFATTGARISRDVSGYTSPLSAPVAGQ
jgi:hypothetical protein